VRSRFGTAQNVELAAALMFTYLGTPMLFAGDECGVNGQNGEHSRVTMAWEQAATGGPRWDRDTHAVIRSLARLRRDVGALATGGLRWAVADDEAVAYLRETPQERILVVIARNAWHGATLPRWVLGPEAPELLFGGSFVDTPSLDVTDDGLRLEATGPAVGIWRLA